MLERLLGHEAWMHTAHHDGNTAGAECAGDFVAAVDIARHRGNPHEVRFQREVDGFDILIGQYNLVPVARNAGGDGKQAASGEYKARFK